MNGADFECGTCAAPGTPARGDNRPSLSSVDYRLGTFGGFREAMLRAVSLDPTLGGLATRASGDHAVTLVELWAAVADVLTFYQERYANEVWLGTATNDRSVQRLAQLIGYRPRPGLSAEAWLAFTLDAGTEVTIPRGHQVQSVPAAGEKPQTYETMAPLVADARLNALAARLAEKPHAAAFAKESTTFVLDRVSAPALADGLRPNASVVLFTGTGTGVEERTVAAVRSDRDLVTVTWTTPIVGTWGPDPTVRRFTRTLRLFGAGAPATWLKPGPSTSSAGGLQWVLTDTKYDVPAGGTVLHVEGRVADLPPGTELLFVPGSGSPKVVTVSATEPGVATVGPLSDTTTKVTVGPLPAYDRRTARIYVLAGPALVPWGDGYPVAPLGTTVYVPGFAVAQDDGADALEIGRSIEGGEWVAGDVLRVDELELGRALLVGPARSPGGSAAGDAPVLAYLRSAALVPAGATAGAFCHLALQLDVRAPLPGQFVELVVRGNVVAASHGETAVEVLGDGTTAPFTRYPLGKHPVTHLRSTGAGGTSSTLEVFVDGVRRDPVPTLYGQAPDAAVYGTFTRPDGTTEVRFGDGVSGAVATAGAGNVTARYRVGSGLAGRVRVGQLSTARRPLPGVGAVENPLASEGGADAENLETARANAPRTVRTLGRAVSLRDLEDLATESGLVVKARATWVWDGFDQRAHLTVAAPGGAPLSADTMAGLVASLDAARDTNQKLQASDFAPVPVRLVATVVVDPRAEHPGAVVAAARAAALAALSFDTNDLGRPLHLSDLEAVLASVPQVQGVDIDAFGFVAMSIDELRRRGVTFRADGSVHPLQAALRVWPARLKPYPPGYKRDRGRIGIQRVMLPAELAVVANPSADVVVTRGSDS